MSRQRSQTDSGVFAVLHHVAGTWRVLIARRTNGRLEIVDTRRFGPDDLGPAGAQDLRQHLDRHKVGRAVTVLPASSVLCRTCTLPDAAPEELIDALNLQAETHLQGTAEAHRIAVAVLERAAGETSRTGIIVSWPPRTDAAPGAPGAAPAPPELSVPMTFAPDVAALTALLNGYRPADPIFWADRATGSVALALTHAAGAVVRATREEGDTHAEWSKNATRALAETALSVGHSGAFAQSLVEAHERHLARDDARPDALVVPREVMDAISRSVTGTEATDEWWSEFGIAAGIAIAATGPLLPLTELEGERAIDVPSHVERITRALSGPRTALATAIICLLIIAFLPLGASGLRLAVLRNRYPDIDRRTTAIDKTESRLAMYKALDKQAWSMTKLLSDVVSNTPQGIELDSVRLQHSDESVFVSGRAVEHEGRTATEVIALMQEVMRDSRLFAEIKLNWDEPNNFGHHDFELSAKIVSPHRRVKYDLEHDYAQWTLAQRQHGEAPSSDIEPEIVAVAQVEPDVALADDPEDDVSRAPREDRGKKSPPPRRSTTDVPRPTFGDVADGTNDPSDQTDRGRGPALNIPAPLTDAQIAAMTLDQATDALVNVAKAKNRVSRDDDPELWERLAHEFDQLMARKREGQ